MAVLLLGVALHYFTWQGRRGNGTSWHDKIMTWLDHARQGSTWKECYGKAFKGSTDRVRTYTFLTEEDSAALLKNRQGWKDRTEHRRAILRITRNSKDIDIALAKLTVWELYAKVTGSKCMLNY